MKCSNNERLERVLLKSGTKNKKIVFFKLESSFIHESLSKYAAEKIITMENGR